MIKSYFFPRAHLPILFFFHADRERGCEAHIRRRNERAISVDMRDMFKNRSLVERNVRPLRCTLVFFLFLFFYDAVSRTKVAAKKDR